MKRIRERFLFYRRAQFMGQQGTMENLLRELHRQFGTREERLVSQSNSSYLDCSEYSDSGANGVFLHVLSYTPNEEMSVVIKEGRPNSILSTTKAPDGTEFWDGDIIIVCRGNDLVMCANSTHEKTFDRYIIGLLQKANRDDASSLFNIISIANVDKIKLIQEGGVKSIRLRAGLHSTTIDRLSDNSIRKKIFGPISKEIKSYIKKNKDFEEILAAENLTVDVLLRFDSRRKGGEIAQDAFKKLGENVVETDSADTFEIETLDGQRLKSDDLQLRKKVSIQAHGKTIISLDARRELELYFSELKEQGALRGAP